MLNKQGYFYKIVSVSEYDKQISLIFFFYHNLIKKKKKLTTSPRPLTNLEKANTNKL